MKKHLLTGVLAMSTLAGVALSQANSAQALSFNGSNVTITGADVGQSFLVNFNGNVNTQNVPGLTSQAIFTFNGFTPVPNNNPNNVTTEAAFTVSLLNTSSNGITSRTSALGFDVLTHTLRGVGTASGAGNTRVTGLFSNDRTGQFPNQFGGIEVCFTNGNTCPGGGNGGVSTGNPAGQFNLVLALRGQNVASFQLGNFGVRYQSITGTNLGNSGTGRGNPAAPVPTPALLPAVLGMGAAALRKKKQEEKVAQEVEC